MADQVHALTELYFLFLQGEAIKDESLARNKRIAEEGYSPRHRDPTLISIAGTPREAGFKSVLGTHPAPHNTKNTMCPCHRGKDKPPPVPDLVSRRLTNTLSAFFFLIAWGWGLGGGLSSWKFPFVFLSDISGRGQHEWFIIYPSRLTERPAQILWLKISLCSLIFLLIFYNCIKDLQSTVRKVHLFKSCYTGSKTSVKITL